MLFDFEIISEIVVSMKTNKMRTFLTGFSITFGILVLVFLLGSGNGLKNSVLQEFEGEDLNTVWVWSGRTDIPHNGLGKDRLIIFNMKDFNDLKNSGFVEKISVDHHIGRKKITYRGETGIYSTIACHPDFMTIENKRIKTGRFINQNDMIGKRKVLVIGQSIADELFPHRDPIGEQLNVAGISYTVIGVWYQKGSTRSMEVYMPFSTAKSIYQSSKDEFYSIGLSTTTVSSKEQNTANEMAIRRLLAENHNFNPRDFSAIGYYSNYEGFSNVNMMFGGVNIFIWIIGIGMLIAGIVGVSNITLVTVKERTNEIGIRRAIGASPKQIMYMILMESVIITTFFGMLGMFLGIGINKVFALAIEEEWLTNVFLVDPGVSIGTAIQATVLMIVAGVLAGYYPAKKALKMKPIDAIRED